MRRSSECTSGKSLSSADRSPLPQSASSWVTSCGEDVGVGRGFYHGYVRGRFCFHSSLMRMAEADNLGGWNENARICDVDDVGFVRSDGAPAGQSCGGRSRDARKREAVGGWLEHEKRRALREAIR